MIIGADIGSYNLNSSTGVGIESRITFISNILQTSKTFELFGTKYYLGDGEFDTEYRKCKKEHYLKMLYGLIATSTTDVYNKVVVGLPISQYANDKNELIELIMKNSMLDGAINGRPRKVIIDNVDVYPEGVGTVPADFRGVVVDIGGRTTDCCLTYIKNNKRKIEKPISIPTGTINLYSDFINLINTNYSLDLTIDDADRILKCGLKYDGVPIDVTEEKCVFKNFVYSLVNKLNVEYPLRTLDIALVGGGSVDLVKPLNRMLPGSKLVDNPIFANSNAFEKRGKEIWL